MRQRGMDDDNVRRSGRKREVSKWLLADQWFVKKGCKWSNETPDEENPSPSSKKRSKQQLRDVVKKVRTSDNEEPLTGENSEPDGLTPVTRRNVIYPKKKGCALEPGCESVSNAVKAENITVKLSVVSTDDEDLTPTGVVLETTNSVESLAKLPSTPSTADVDKSSLETAATATSARPDTVAVDVVDAAIEYAVQNEEDMVQTLQLVETDETGAVISVKMIPAILTADGSLQFEAIEDVPELNQRDDVDASGSGLIATPGGAQVLIQDETTSISMEGHEDELNEAEEDEEEVAAISSPYDSVASSTAASDSNAARQSSSQDSLVTVIEGYHSTETESDEDDDDDDDHNYSRKEVVLLELQEAYPGANEGDPESVHVAVVTDAVTNGDRRTLTCHVYNKCSLHPHVVPKQNDQHLGDKATLPLRDEGDAAGKFSSFECIDKINLREGLSTVVSRVADVFVDESNTATVRAEATESTTEKRVVLVDGDVRETDADDEDVSTTPDSAVPRRKSETPEETDIFVDENGQVLDMASIMRENFVYGCAECSFTSPSLATLKNHSVRHSTAFMKFLCETCGKGFSTSGNVARHKLIHQQNKPFSCEHCQKAFTQKVHLHRHMEEHKMMALCPHCSYTTLYRCGLGRHIEENHPAHPYIKLHKDKQRENVIWQCGVCGNESLSKKELTQHLKHHTSRNPLNFKCHLCNFVTDFACRLKRHILSHTQQRPFKCGLCVYRGTQLEHVMRHMRSIHGVDAKHSVMENSAAQAPLEQTGEGSEAAETLGHAMSLAQPAKVILPECPNELKQTGLVHDIRKSSRMRTTTKDAVGKLFTCNFCAQQFQRPRNMIKHLEEMHSAVPDRFRCCFAKCEAEFTDTAELLEHLNTHKPCRTPVEFHCSYCDFITEKRRNFVYHMQSKHYKIVTMGRVNKRAVSAGFVQQGQELVSTASTLATTLNMSEHGVVLTDVNVAEKTSVADLVHALLYETGANNGGGEAEDDATRTPKAEIEGTITADADSDMEEARAGGEGSNIMQVHEGDLIEIDGEVYEVKSFGSGQEAGVRKLNIARSSS